ncbi:NAD(P)/FAD-dependent oxidoreductase [Cellulomonas denverensis]|uniref:NAD(P)/FAD-dependent oxidoreductase n=1 Tax=Cellulomonas denverensis TaxID=264297 RepID=UPI001EF33384|nr:FAD-dependent oxidoreductase [Cellulomonas denverensis]
MSAADHPAARPPARILVVGAGLAGARTVLELRRQGYRGWIGLLGAEPVPPYDRPPLSKHLLDRPAPAWLADELDADALAAADEVRLATAATGLHLDPDGVRVRLAGADDLTADAVVIATGSVPMNPWPAARVLHTATDAEALRGALATARRLVIIGAGWIGAEVAGVAAAAGTEVTVLEALAGPLPVLGAVGELTRPWWEAAGVQLRTGVRVATVDAAGVSLEDGSRVDGDLVLAAVGARPATDWLDGTLPRDLDGSVRVDEHLAPVGVPGADRVRLVGDVARRRSARHGWVGGGHWDAALRGPAVAVASLLGEPVAEDPAPYVFSTQFGRELALYGEPGRSDDLVLRGDPAGGDGWTALWFAAGSDRLTAVFTVDRPRDVAGARRLFAADRLPELDPVRASDPELPLKSAVRA